MTPRERIEIVANAEAAAASFEAYAALTAVEALEHWADGSLRFYPCLARAVASSWVAVGFRAFARHYAAPRESDRG